ncbi:myosin-2 essential light chain [Drosophila kikkawai]|uniref:Myosin-2 essential light chain n=1 Tax=Drosophila kikkawai TaxID=30033 RepID=A0A6P4I027_DROKI|nr:myosin-2 essential light chain [Drosophila kikkawai]
MLKADNQCHTSSKHPSLTKAVINRQKSSNRPPPPPCPKPKRSHILEMHDIFLKHDSRGDNKIAVGSLGDCLRAMGANPSQQVIKKHISLLETGTIRRISFDEVMAIYSSLGKCATKPSARRRQAQEDEFTFSLRLYDVDNSGYMPASRLRRILTRCEDCMTEAEVNELLAGRIDAHGMVNYGQLIHDIVNG